MSGAKRMRNRFPVSWMLLLASLILSACRTGGEVTTTAGATTLTQSETTPQTTLTQPMDMTTTAGLDDFILGNFNRNYANNGLYAENDQWVWYARFPEQELKRMRPDGTELTRLGVDPVYSLNLTADALYFVKGIPEEENGGSIYRMSLDGSELTQVSPVLVNIMASCILVDDWFYFANMTGDDHLYRMKIDGSDLQELNQEKVSRLNAANGWIFCQIFSVATTGEVDSAQLWRFRPDGSESTVLAQAGSPLILAHQEWLYYLDPNNQLSRMKQDGSQAEVLMPGQQFYLNLEGDTLFYIDPDLHDLMSCDLDGTNRHKVVDFSLGPVQVAGGWLYAEGSSRRMYRMRPDGSEFQKAYSLEMVQPDPPGTPVVTGLGVDNANLSDEVRFASDGQSLYMAEQSFTGGIIRMQPDGSQRNRILDRGGNDLNLVGDWLYFMDQNAYGSLARMRTDGTGYGVIHDGEIKELIVRDNWIYFIQGYQERSLWKIKTDGTSLTKLHDGPIAKLYLAEDWLYWTKYLGEGWESDGIYRMKTDGLFEEFLYQGTITTLTVGKEFIYYGLEDTATGEIKVFRMDLAGAFRKPVLSEGNIRLFGVVGSHLYYSTGGTQRPIMRCRLDGTQAEAITQPGSYVQIHFINGKILFYDNAIQNYWRIDPDGSNANELQQPGEP